MEGKEKDIQMALVFRENFIKEYNDDKKFQFFLEELLRDSTERWIHQLIREKKISLTTYYKYLKERAAILIFEQKRTIFIEICKIKVAREWINDNGKYKDLGFKVVYDLYKKDEKILGFIEKN